MFNVAASAYAAVVFSPDSIRSVDHLTLIARSVEAAGRSWAICVAEQGQLRFLRVNSAFEDMTHMVRSDVIGKSHDILLGAKSDVDAIEILRAAVASQRPATATLAMYRANGALFWAELSVAPIEAENAEADTPYFVVVYTDVTQQVQTQNELKKAWEAERSAHIQQQSTSRRLQALLSQMPTGVVVVEAPSGRVVGMNPQASQLLGSLHDLSLVDDDVKVAVSRADGSRYRANELPVIRALASGQSTPEEDCEFMFPIGTAGSVGGSRKGYAVMKAVPVADGDGNTVAGMLLIDDITKRRRAEIELVESRRKSVELAHSLQQSLLPSKFPVVDFAEFGSQFTPAGEGLEVGGDFYDVFEQRDGDVVAVIGDVMGKGVGAAAVTSLVRHVIRTTALRSRRVSTLLQMLNEALCRESGETPFATVATALFVADEVTRTVEMTVGLAGHAQLLVLRANGNVNRVGIPGTLVGIVEEIEVFEDRTTLAAGDSVVFFTDGVTEARNSNGEFFGEEQLVETLSGLDVEDRRDAQRIASAVGERVRRFSQGEACDDIAVMVVRISDKFSH